MTNRTPTTVRFVALAAIWGSSFTLIRVALDGLTPAQLVLGRLVAGTAVMLALIAGRRVGLPRGGVVWGHVTVTAVLANVAPFLLLSYGEQTAGAGAAGVLVGATPLVTLGLAAVALPAERVTARRIAGLVAGFAGVVLVVGPWHGSAGSLAGLLACLGGAACYATGFVYVRRFLSPRGLAPLPLATAQLAAATVLQALATPWMPWHAPRFTGAVLASILVLGAIGTGLANVLYFRLIADTGATNAAAVNYLVPVVAVAVGAVALGEPVTWNEVAGGLVVLAAMAYAENRLTAGRRRPEPAPAATPAGPGGARGRLGSGLREGFAELPHQAVVPASGQGVADAEDEGNRPFDQPEGGQPGDAADEREFLLGGQVDDADERKFDLDAGTANRAFGGEQGVRDREAPLPTVGGGRTGPR